MKLLLSYREAARLLGISRGPKLHALVKARLLNPVTLLGRSYIPREQIEALARSGDSKPVPARTRVKRPRGGSIADIVIV